MVLVQLALATSTVLPIEVLQRPSEPILRPPETATVEDALMRLAVFAQPALDDLDAVDVRPLGIAHCVNREDGSLAGRSLEEIAAHGHAVGIAVRGEVRAIIVRRYEVPARE